MDIININGDDYIGLGDVRNYLEFPSTIYFLETFYLKRKAGTKLYFCTPESQDQYDSETDDYWFKLSSNGGTETVFIDGLIKLDVREPVWRSSDKPQPKKNQWDSYYTGRQYEMTGANTVIGLVNGVMGEHVFKYQKVEIDLPSSLSDLASNNDLYAKVSELDALSKKYAIPKAQVKEALSKVNVSSPLSPVTPLTPADNLPEESLGAPTKKQVKHGVIEPKKPSNNNEEWRVVYKVIKAYELKHGYTPIFDEQVISLNDLFINPPTTHSDTFDAIKTQASDYVNERSTLPNKQQLWLFLKGRLSYNSKNNSVIFPELDKPMNYDAFTSNFNRWTKSQ